MSFHFTLYATFNLIHVSIHLTLRSIFFFSWKKLNVRAMKRWGSSASEYIILSLSYSIPPERKTQKYLKKKRLNYVLEHSGLVLRRAEETCWEQTAVEWEYQSTSTPFSEISNSRWIFSMSTVHRSHRRYRPCPIGSGVWSTTLIITWAYSFLLRVISLYTSFRFNSNLLFNLILLFIPFRIC